MGICCIKDQWKPHNVRIENQTASSLELRWDFDAALEDRLTRDEWDWDFKLFSSDDKQAGQAFVGVDRRSHTFNDLTPGTYYEGVIHARTTQGVDLRRGEVPIPRDSTKPEKPVLTESKVLSNKIQFKLFCTGAENTELWLTRTGNDARLRDIRESSNGKEVEFTDLEPGNSYTVHARGHVHGLTGESAVEDIHTQHAPVSVSLWQRTIHTLVIEWKKPLEGPFDEYVITCSLPNERIPLRTLERKPDHTRACFKNLDSGTKYDICITTSSPTRSREPCRISCETKNIITVKRLALGDIQYESVEPNITSPQDVAMLMPCLNQEQRQDVKNELGNGCLTIKATRLLCNIMIEMDDDVWWDQFIDALKRGDMKHDVPNMLKEAFENEVNRQEDMRPVINRGSVRSQPNEGTVSVKVDIGHDDLERGALAGDISPEQFRRALSEVVIQVKLLKDIPIVLEIQPGCVSLKIRFRTQASFSHFKRAFEGETVKEFLTVLFNIRSAVEQRHVKFQVEISPPEMKQCDQELLIRETDRALWVATEIGDNEREQELLRQGAQRRLLAKSTDEMAGDLDTPEQMLPDHHWIIAVDIGTDGTGYAFSKSTDNDIFINNAWDDGPSETYKTKTCILQEANGEFVAFGSHAQTIFLGMKPEEAKRFLYFEDFKMSLYNTNVSKKSLLTAANGRTVNAHTVFAAALRYIKGRVEQHIKSSTGGRVLQAEDVLYVLTVPAIWSEDAKYFMRDCAYEAGLIDRKDPDRLLLGLEPEAAGIYCRSLPASNFLGKEGPSAIGEAIPQETFIVVDAGGGTVDIAVQEIDAMGNIKEVYQPTGGPWGGKYCSDGIFTLFTDIFGKDVIHYLEKNSPVEFADMVQTVENAKRLWSTNESMKVKLNSGFFDAVQQCRKLAPGAVTKYVQKHESGVAYVSGTIVINAAIVKRVLDEIIDKIIKHLWALLTMTPVKAASRMFLVGGFSESKYLRHRIKTAFQSKLQVHIPLDGGAAVMKGAVLFGRKFVH